MKNKIWLGVSLVLAALTILYLLASFCLWEFDPGMWSVGTRSLLAMFAAIVLLVGTVVTVENIVNKK